jgi:predicted nucleic acid-binding protein
MSSSLVLDTSVWVSWLSPSDVNHEVSHMWIEQYITRDGVFIVPTFLLVEVAAAISRRTGQSLQAKETIRNLRTISTIHIVPLTSWLINRAIDVAAELQLRASERGNNRDIADVKLLIQHEIVTLDELDKAYQEVLAQLGKGRYPRITPQRFTERYQTIRQLL